MAYSNYRRIFKRYTRNAKRYAPGAIAFANQLRMKRPAYDNTRKKNTSGAGVTNQYDRKVVYRKKTMPNYKKRPWIRFVKKVNAVMSKRLSTRTIIFNSQTRITSTEAGTNFTQGCICMHLLSANGANYSPLDSRLREISAKDLSDFMYNDSTSDEYTEKIMIKSAVLDATVRNSSSEVTMEVDIYEIMTYGNKHTTSFLADQVGTEALPPVIGSSTALTITTRGATPFDFPTHLRMGVKIMKKTKYLLSPNEVTTYQIRDARDHNFSVANLGTVSCFTQAGMTRTILIIGKPVVSASVAALTWELTAGVTRKYSYVDLNQEDAHGRL